jgi:organic hydroperoxide reductase OsmC/OhrA
VKEQEMTGIPMNYQTTYQWQAEAADGVIYIEGHAELLVGRPHDLDRYCPEHLLVAAAETCLANYVIMIASMSNLEVKDYRSSAEGELEHNSKAGYRFKRIIIRPELTIAGTSQALAEQILEKAHNACLIAHSLNCPVDIEPRIII